MNGRRALATAFMTVTLVLAGALPADAQGHSRYSGTIVSIADDAKSFVLAEVGPWQLRDGRTVVTHRTITLAPETAFAVVLRSPQAPSGFPNDFVEFPVGPESVFLDDHVTVECRHVGQRLIAVKVTVTGVPTPSR